MASAGDLAGKVSLVTGGSRGIGAAIAISLAKAGSDVVVNYRDGEAAVEEVSDRIRAEGRTALKSKFDVTDLRQVTDAVDAAVAQLGHIDILINNAGITRDKTLARMTKEEWEEVLSVNLTGVFNVTKATMPQMRTRGWGRIINISSVIGIMGNIGQSNYSAAKAGVLGFSRSIAKEVASVGITVNVVAPGFTQTSMVESLAQPIKDTLLSKIPMKRFATPYEIGDLVAFLSSPRTAYITGELFTISGGLS
jgi:3-oxoacyl-[acyl-carrier protein] reductase